MKKLDFTFVRLYALHKNYIIGVEQIPHIYVADPYYMHEGFLGVCAKHHEYAQTPKKPSCMKYGSATQI